MMVFSSRLQSSTQEEQVGDAFSCIQILASVLGELLGHYSAAYLSRKAFSCQRCIYVSLFHSLNKSVLFWN